MARGRLQPHGPVETSSWHVWSPSTHHVCAARWTLPGGNMSHCVQARDLRPLAGCFTLRSSWQPMRHQWGMGTYFCQVVRHVLSQGRRCTHKVIGAAIQKLCVTILLQTRPFCQATGASFVMARGAWRDARKASHKVRRVHGPKADAMLMVCSTLCNGHKRCNCLARHSQPE